VDVEVNGAPTKRQKDSMKNYLLLCLFMAGAFGCGQSPSATDPDTQDKAQAVVTDAQNRLEVMVAEVQHQAQTVVTQLSPQLGQISTQAQQQLKAINVVQETRKAFDRFFAPRGDGTK
jgi:TolA-binding protein